MVTAVGNYKNPVINKSSDVELQPKKVTTTKKEPEKCGTTPNPAEDNDLNEWEEMFVQGPAGMEWNGPTRGGARPEPTRFGDWERKGRVSDF